MGKRNRNQWAAKDRRKKKRKRAGELGIKRPIKARHEKGTGKQDKQGKKKQKQQSVTLYQLVLTRGPGYSYEVGSWVSNIRRLCDKTDREADDILIKAIAYADGLAVNPPALLSCTSTSDADMHRLRFDSSIRDAIKIVEKETG